MLLFEIDAEISAPNASGPDLFDHLRTCVQDGTPRNFRPVRFAVVKSHGNRWCCELGGAASAHDQWRTEFEELFQFRHRVFERTNQFNTVFLVPTGIGAILGGHAGDACPAVRVLAAATDRLITHPNAVNASDINEMPANGLFVEGSIITRLLMGTIGLQEVRRHLEIMRR